MTYVCILQLEKGKYYVTGTDDPTKEYEMHLKGLYSLEWTKIYRPIKVFYSFFTKDPYDEEKATLRLMEKVGTRKSTLRIS